MAPTEKFEKILHGLLEKTKKNKIAWKITGPKDIFMVSFPNSKIKMSWQSPETEPDYIQFEFLGTDGARALSFAVAEGDELWPIAQELFSEVERIVTGWDKVLEDVEKHLFSAN